MEWLDFVCQFDEYGQCMTAKSPYQNGPLLFGKLSTSLDRTGPSWAHCTDIGLRLQPGHRRCCRGRSFGAAPGMDGGTRGLGTRGLGLPHSASSNKWPGRTRCQCRGITPGCNGAIRIGLFRYTHIGDSTKTSWILLEGIVTPKTMEKEIAISLGRITDCSILLVFLLS